MREKREKRPEMRRHGIVPPITFGEVITADHHVSSEDHDSQHRCVVVVQEFFFLDPDLSCDRTESTDDTMRSLRQFFPPSLRPESIYSDHAVEFIRVCEDAHLSHDTSLLADLTQTQQPEELSEESQKEQHVFWCNAASQTVGGVKLWHVLAP